MDLYPPSKLYLQLIVTEHGFFAQAAMFIQLGRTAIHAKQIAPFDFEMKSNSFKCI